MIFFTEEIKKEIRKIISEFELEYTFIGIRVQECPFEIGPLNHNSNRWFDGEDTGEELDGACAIGLKVAANIRDESVLELVSKYFGEHVAIIAGDQISYGEDPGEIVIRHAVVLAILS